MIKNIFNKKYNLPNVVITFKLKKKIKYDHSFQQTRMSKPIMIACRDYYKEIGIGYTPDRNKTDPNASLTHISVYLFGSKKKYSEGSEKEMTRTLTEVAEIIIGVIRMYAGVNIDIEDVIRPEESNLEEFTINLAVGHTKNFKKGDSSMGIYLHPKK